MRYQGGWFDTEKEQYEFSETERSRLEGFIHAAYAAASERYNIAQGQDAWVESTWKEKDGKHKLKTFPIDEKLVTVMDDIAFAMYYGNPKLGVPGLKDAENTKWGADTALITIFEEFGAKDRESIDKAEEIWRR